MPVAFLRFTQQQEIFGLNELPQWNLVGQCMRLWGEMPRESGTEALLGTLQKTYIPTLFFSALLFICLHMAAMSRASDFFV